MLRLLYWAFLSAAILIVTLPGSPPPARIIAALLAFLVWYFGRAAAPLGSVGRPVRAPRATLTNFGASPAGLRHLHDELLTLVGGDERVLRRLVLHERQNHKTAAECYRAAIDRLVRDRQ